ncbi:superoxide dismutase (Cu/Zn) [Oceanicola granulosus HTCC2516]|uniref:Superoxide dismutase (Cu/Zn) n=1 Tax=Oceanicola granulosus (strain ATCC BAA-861 / DSM 15982 / KCTC 12143 / HTCC2516) TaxID=314256 RepID=Q2CDX6_OCEGH|nr:superoxide dismutase family protein [Oceanicola granulosus]EAR50852.1 superoxide dismutase (Cu/Zn) [Oceanicola granulosus HTCC2516]
MKSYQLALASLTACTLGTAALADSVSGEVMDRDGNAVGTVSVEDTASGRALVTLDLNGLPEGMHAVHLHETGDCSADDFSSAGGHIAGDNAHGVLAEGGPHPGDMPNLEIDADGTAWAEVFLSDLDVGTHLTDEDGAAFIVHAGTDDYESQPSGDAGDRIACAELAAQ